MDNSTALKVLIVDDEEGIANFMAKILEARPEGYKPFTALNSSQAMAIYNAEAPDMCILDVHLTDSDKDGVEILEEIKTINPAAACIMVTRITDPAKAQKARELGALHYLLKPYNTKELIAIINKVAGDVREGNRA